VVCDIAVDNPATSKEVIFMIEVTAAALAAHPFLYGMSHDHLAVLADAASDVTFPARHRLIEDGHSATRFWLIQSGHVILDLHVPGQGPANSTRPSGTARTSPVIRQPGGDQEPAGRRQRPGEQAERRLSGHRAAQVTGSHVQLIQIGSATRPARSASHALARPFTGSDGPARG
jgi:hypothetical protein